ncbi:hypothetical protein SNEBB_005350 [Seison nebaliae]|nr:hypothetical protein SNEBB_005350 [Seison nebaliae]
MVFKAPSDYDDNDDELSNSDDDSNFPTIPNTTRSIKQPLSSSDSSTTSDSDIETKSSPKHVESARTKSTLDVIMEQRNKLPATTRTEIVKIVEDSPRTPKKPISKSVPATGRTASSASPKRKRHGIKETLSKLRFRRFGSKKNSKENISTNRSDLTLNIPETPKSAMKKKSSKDFSSKSLRSISEDQLNKNIPYEYHDVNNENILKEFQRSLSEEQIPNVVNRQFLNSHYRERVMRNNEISQNEITDLYNRLNNAELKSEDNYRKFAECLQENAQLENRISELKEMQSPLAKIFEEKLLELQKDYYYQLEKFEKEKEEVNEELAKEKGKVIHWKNEVVGITNRYEDREERLKTMQNKLDKLQSSRFNENDYLDDMNNNLKHMQEQLLKSENRWKTVNEQYEKVMKENERLIVQLNKKKSDMEHYQKKEHKLEEQIIHLNKNLFEMKNENGKQRAELFQVKNKETILLNEAVKVTNEQVAYNNASNGIALDKLQTELKKSQNIAQQAAMQLQRLRQNENRLNSEIKRLHHRYHQTREDHSRELQSLESRLMSLKKSNDSMEMRFDKLYEEKRRADNTVSELKTALTDLQEKYKSNMSTNKEHELNVEISLLKQQMTFLENRCQTKKSDYEKELSCAEEKNNSLEDQLNDLKREHDLKELTWQRISQNGDEDLRKQLTQSKVLLDKQKQLSSKYRMECENLQKLMKEHLNRFESERLSLSTKVKIMNEHLTKKSLECEKSKKRIKSLENEKDQKDLSLESATAQIQQLGKRLTDQKLNEYLRILKTNQNV